MTQEILLVLSMILSPAAALAGAPDAVYVEPVALTDAAGTLGIGMNLGAIVTETGYADGLQAAADGWGLNLDCFVTTDVAERRRLADRLVAAGETLLIIQPVSGEDWAPVRKAAQERMQGFRLATVPGPTDRFKAGIEELKSARASIVTRLPKLQEVMPIACPVSPLPDSFFTPSGTQPPRPVLRSDRQVATASAPAHATIGAVMTAVTGSLAERASTTDPDRLVIDIEGGLAAVRALPGAAENGRLSSVLTGCQIAIRGPGGRDRDLVLENNGVEPSGFKPAVAFPEELERALDGWKADGRISGYRRVGDDGYELSGWHGATRMVRGEFFLTLSAESARRPQLEEISGPGKRYALVATSTRGTVQHLAEPGPGIGVAPHLKDILHALSSPSGEVASYLLDVEGGQLAVTTEQPLSAEEWNVPVERIDLDVRGPLTANQAVTLTLAGRGRRVFRRTVLRAAALDEAVAELRDAGWISGWTKDGVRGRGLAANVVLERYLGRHRRFMSSLFVHRTASPPVRAGLRWWVDSLQRLGFSLRSPDGWEQAFVETPMRVVPAPRDVVFAPIAPPLP